MISTFVLLGAAAFVSAAEPALREVSPRGLQVGATTRLIVDGDELGTSPRLLLPFPARVELQTGATANRATFDVTLESNVTAGYANLRVVTDGGVTLPVVLGVDRLPQRPLTPAIEQLPAALSGTAGGANPVETKFAGKAGQPIMIEVEAQRLGSKLRPVIHLYNARRKQLAWAWATPALGGDARVETTLPVDGEYTIALHDVEYAPPGPSYFRMKVGQWGGVDQVFPPEISMGQSVEVELIGPGGPTRVALPPASSTGVFPVPWPNDAPWSGPRPIIQVSAISEVVEQPAAGGMQELPAGPVGVSGRLLARHEEDRYRVNVVPGSRLRLEVFAERLGSVVDAALVVRNEQGGLLARGEDSPGSVDPVLEYAVPGDVKSLIIGVVDAQGRGGPRAAYRLAVDPGASPAKPDFRLSTPAQRVSLSAGGRTVVPVFVDRRGYRGPVELAAATLPAGIVLENATIPEEGEGALVTVARGEGVAEPVITTWRGRTADGDEREVFLKGHPLERRQPWMATELAVAPTSARAADFQVEWRNVPADAALIFAGRLALPVKFTRPADNSLVRLSLLTSQAPPLANGQPDPNPARQLRAEKPIELAANVVEGELTAIVPAELAAPIYDVTVLAELLSADKRVVLASAHAPVKRLPVRTPLVVTPASPRIDVALDAKQGATVKIEGKIDRQNGLKGEATVTLSGLPAGARADAVNVKADAADFVISLVLPTSVPEGELKGLKLSASIVPDPGQPNLRVRSREFDIVLVVKKVEAKP